VKVAVIDTGAAVDHPDLVGRVQDARNFVDDDEHAFVTDRHGTLVAGIIGAVANNRLGIVGVSPGAHLQILKACEPLRPDALAAQCNSFTLALALSAAIDRRAQIVNLSLSGPADPLLAQLVAQGERRGMLFVGAMPSDGGLNGFPLGVSGVIAARNSDAATSAPNEVPAPGQDIVSLTPGGHYDFASGSSLAAAQVSGALALLLAVAPHAGAPELLAALRGSIEPRGAHGEVIDVCVALAHLQPRDVCAQSTDAQLTNPSHPDIR
jgi:subtilisin family serine protease